MGKNMTDPNSINRDIPEWIRAKEAARLDIVPVHSETLKLMIKRGDVPEGHWKTEEIYGQTVYYIDKHILRQLEYKKQGKRGADKRKRKIVVKKD
jgi:hypothetical protein